MTPEYDIQPPRWAQRFLEWYCRPELLEDLQGDLNEYFQRNLKNKGKRKARWIYIIDVVKFLRSYTIRTSGSTNCGWLPEETLSLRLPAISGRLE